MSLKSKEMKTEQRVIKYRAWNERINEMWDCDRLALNMVHMSVTGNGFLTHDEDGVLELLPFLKPMQFTGLFDKEGNEIYEWDKVKWRHPSDNSYREGIINYNQEEGAFLINDRFYMSEAGGR